MSFFNFKTKNVSLFRTDEIDISKRAYDAASTGNRISNWKVAKTDSNAEISKAGSSVRDRARDLVRNNPYAKRIIDVIATSVVGTGFLPTSDNKEYLTQLNTWINSTDCDFEGFLNFFGIQDLVIRCVVEGGGCFVVKYLDNTKELPLQLKVLEPDFLDVSKNNNTTIEGIEYLPNGKIKGYWLWSQHPASTTQKNNKSNFYPLENVIHIFRQDRVGQQVGISWLAPVIIKLKKLEEYNQALLEKAGISNLIVGFIYDNNLESPSTTSETLSLEPAALLTLPPGKDVKFSTPPDLGDPNIFIKSFLHAIAVGAGITYPALTNDYSDVNFSSAKMEAIEFGKNVDNWRYNLFIPKFLDRINVWFFESLIKQKEQPKVTWTPPRKVFLDASKEIPPIVDAIRAGLLTPSEAIREQGYDFFEFIAEYKRDLETLDKEGIVLSCDVRQDSKRIQAIGNNDKNNN